MNCPTCNVHIEEHPANACLNEWIAADIMGEEKPSIEHDHLHLYSINSEGGNWYCLCEYDKGDTCVWYAKNFSVYIGAAWQVVEEVGSFWTIQAYFYEGRAKSYYAGIRGHIGTRASTLSLAICRVAIKARIQGVSE